MIFINKGVDCFFFNKKKKYLNIIEYYKNNFFLLNYFVSDILVTNYSKGKGFQGTIKKWNFKTKDKSHGNSLSYRTLGSTGQCQTPGKVIKGKKMPGRLGNKKFSFFTKIFFRKKNFFFINKIIPGNINDKILVKIL